jgi:hypothetical protein
MRARIFICSSLLFALSACSSDEGNKSAPGAGGKAGSGSTTQEGGAATTNKAGSSSSGGSGGHAGQSANFGGAPMHTGPMFAGAECPTDLGFPDAYALPNVKGLIEGANARITFDPQGDAVDYRVYALPKSKISGDTIDGAVYRCAGAYEVPAPAMDDATKPENPGFRTRVQSTVSGFARTAADATLGYVYTTPADDRIPVYALGDSDVHADNASCYYMRWPEGRVKRYTTDEAERKDLLSKRWRDDGIVFYVPKPGADGTEPIYGGSEGDSDFAATLYMKGGPEHDKRAKDGLKMTEAFSVYSKERDGAEPLMRVFYQQACGRAHDELVPGLARFNKAYQQGSSPVAELHYSGLTEETTLVVEALDAKCPFQGPLAATSRPAHTETYGADTVDYPAFRTPDEQAGAWPTGELFVNGQGDDTKPKAISRACLKVKPDTAPDLDFFYDGSVEEFTTPKETGYQTYELESPTFNVQFTSVETESFAIGSLFGELWATYSDKASDTNGKLRITPKKRATLAAEQFVHAVMEVDTVSSQRRYPQLIVSNAEWPVQDKLDTSGTVIVQMFGGVTDAMEVQIQFCDHRAWDVNNQCPNYKLYKLKAPTEFLAPSPEINGFQGTDRTVRFDVYVSTKRAYVFTNTQPYGCAVLPEGKLDEGTATVTFADVLYHSGVDLAEWYPFHVAKMQRWTSRHFSNLGFSSKIDQPVWDESRLPCAPASDLE